MVDIRDIDRRVRALELDARSRRSRKIFFHSMGEPGLGTLRNISGLEIYPLLLVGDLDLSRIRFVVDVTGTDLVSMALYRGLKANRSSPVGDGVSGESLRLLSVLGSVPVGSSVEIYFIDIEPRIELKQDVFYYLAINTAGTGTVQIRSAPSAASPFLGQIPCQPQGPALFPNELSFGAPSNTPGAPDVHLVSREFALAYLQPD